MTSTRRLGAALLAGCGTAIALGIAATMLARHLWPAYAAAEPTKAYSLGMLVMRLSVGALCTAGAACVTTLVAPTNRAAAWWLGGLFLAIALPDHIMRVWADYPVWYHLVFLAYLLPIAGQTGRSLYSRVSPFNRTRAKR